MKISMETETNVPVVFPENPDREIITEPPSDVPGRRADNVVCLFNGVSTGMNAGAAS